MKQVQTEQALEQARLRQASAFRRQLVSWFDQPLGHLLQAAIASHLNTVLSSLYGNVVLQLGRVGHMKLMEGTAAPTQIMLDLNATTDPDRSVRSHAYALPFEGRSVDIAILPHTLDFAEDPHKVLRELDRVLIPEGHAVIIGFNPFSLWGLRHVFSWKKKQAPWNARFFSAARINDWMSLLGYEVEDTKLLFQRPPVKNQKVMQKLFFLEKLGNRLLPQIAAVYVIVVKKQVLGMTPLQPNWKTSKRFIRGLAEPAAKVIHPQIPQWRLHRDSQG
jgi:SAM-dependent methyltransferase